MLAGLEDMGLAKTEHYATALINTGDVYIASREPKEALKLFLSARKLLIECGLSGDYRMAALCNNISMVYRNDGEFSKAEQALDIAFNIIKGLPECRGELATTYINLGQLQIRQSKLEMARGKLFGSLQDIPGGRRQRCALFRGLCRIGRGVLSERRCTESGGMV